MMLDGKPTKKEVCKAIDANQKIDPCRILDGMSSKQEVCNAISMLAPSLVVGLFALRPPSKLYWRSWRTVLHAMTTGLSASFSISYHVQLAMRTLENAVDCAPRRLDQTMIHVHCAGLACSLSTDIRWSVGACLLNAYFIKRLHSAKEAGVIERLVNIGLAALVYGISVLLRGEVRTFARGLTSWIGSIVLMLLRFGGWGHSMMHVAIGGHTYFILRALEAHALQTPAAAKLGHSALRRPQFSTSSKFAEVIRAFITGKLNRGL